MAFDLSAFLTFVTALTTVGFVVMAVFWLKRLRSSVSGVMGEAALQQVRTAQHLTETIDRIQKNQQLLEQQIQTLALAHRQLRLDVQVLVNRAESTDAEVHANPFPNKTFH